MGRLLLAMTVPSAGLNCTTGAWPVLSMRSRLASYVALSKEKEKGMFSLLTRRSVSVTLVPTSTLPKCTPGRSSDTRGSFTWPTMRKGTVMPWSGMRNCQKPSVTASSSGMYSNAIS